MFFATCLFGIAFIILENSAHNSIAFASNVLAASNSVQTPGKVVAIAITVNTFCCLLHAISRRWGIIINNVFGTFKFLVLVFIVIIGFIHINSDVAKVNFDPSTSFSTTNMPKSPFRYAEAFMFVIFPYGAFHQVNYVRLQGSIGIFHTIDKDRSFQNLKIPGKRSHELRSTGI